MMLGVVTAMRADDAPPPFHDNRPYTGDFPDDAVIKMPFPWSINVRCSSMEGSFAFLLGDIPLNISPLSPNTPSTPSQVPPNQYAPNIPPIPISMPEAWAWAQGPGPMGIEGYWRGIRLGGHWRCWRGIGGSLVCQWYINGTLMVR